MSDEPQPGAQGAVPPDPPAKDESAGALATATCPSCGVVVRNIQAESGAKVRCLNCGQRFVPGSDRVAKATTVMRRCRETHVAAPRSAGYWLWRIPAAIAWAGAVVAAALIVKELFRQRSLRLDQYVALSYVPLLPLGGLFLMLLTRGLACADGGAIKAAWLAGVITAPLPAPRGSSLPYVAPVAVAGGVLPLVLVSGNFTNMGAVLSAALWGAGLLYLGFALEDLRQFTWRQECLGWACYKAAGGQEPMESVRRRPVCGLLLCVIALLFAACALMVFLDLVTRPWQWYYGTGERELRVFTSIALMGASWSLYLLGRGWDRAVMWWELAAAQGGTGVSRLPVGPTLLSGQPAQPLAWPFSSFAGRFGFLLACGTFLFVYQDYLVVRHTGSRHEAFYANVVAPLSACVFAFVAVTTFIWFGWRRDRRLPIGMDCFCRVPWLWAACGAAWFGAMCVARGNLGNNRGFDTAALFCLLGAFAVCAAWVAVFLSQACRWRSAQERYWSLREPEPAAAPARRPWWHRWLVRGAVWLAVCQALYFSYYLASEFLKSPSRGRNWIDWVAVLGFPLLLTLIHYPTMWLALLVRDFLALEWLYRGRGEEE